MKRKRQREKAFGAPEKVRERKRGRIINYEYDLDAIKHLWGGYTPFAPKNCPSQRCVISMEDNIKWVDNTLCLRYCPELKDRCESHKLYREHLHEMRKYPGGVKPTPELRIRERVMSRSRNRLRNRIRTRSRRRVKN